MKAVIMAFAMFSRVPMPRIDWDERNQRYMLAAFPLVGVAAGLLLWLWQLLCVRMAFTEILWAAGLAVVPLLLTGGIHMDGFADTVDALASHAEPARKREILKDPHSGAFAITAVAAYLLSYFALGTQLNCTAKTAWTLLLLHALSRTGAGLCTLCFPAASANGLLSLFRAAADKRKCVMLLSAWALALSLALFLLNRPWDLVLPLCAAGAALYLKSMSQKQFGGMSGDLSGYYIVVSEIVMLAALVMLERGAV